MKDGKIFYIFPPYTHPAVPAPIAADTASSAHTTAVPWHFVTKPLGFTKRKREAVQAIESLPHQIMNGGPKSLLQHFIHTCKYMCVYIKGETLYTQTDFKEIPVR